MTQEEVRRAENGEPDPRFSQGDILLWKTELLGEEVLVIYKFAFNKLVRAKYAIVKYSQDFRSVFKSPASPPLGSQYVLDFDKFEKALINKYGQPNEQYLGAPKEVTEDKKTDSETIQRHIDMTREAIQNRKTAWYSKWNTKDTAVLLILHGDSGHLNLELGYSSILLGNIRENAL
jgi:hypothetical protein